MRDDGGERAAIAALTGLLVVDAFLQGGGSLIGGRTLRRTVLFGSITQWLQLATLAALASNAAASDGWSRGLFVAATVASGVQVASDHVYEFVASRHLDALGAGVAGIESLTWNSLLTGSRGLSASLAWSLLAFALVAHSPRKRRRPLVAVAGLVVAAALVAGVLEILRISDLLERGSTVTAVGGAAAGASLVALAVGGVLLTRQWHDRDFSLGETLPSPRMGANLLLVGTATSVAGALIWAVSAASSPDLQLNALTAAGLHHLLGVACLAAGCGLLSRLPYDWAPTHFRWALAGLVGHGLSIGLSLLLMSLAEGPGDATVGRTGLWAAAAANVIGTAVWLWLLRGLQRLGRTLDDPRLSRLAGLTLASTITFAAAAILHLPATTVTNAPRLATALLALMALTAGAAAIGALLATFRTAATRWSSTPRAR